MLKPTTAFQGLVFDASYVQINPAENGSMLVEPLFTMSSIQKATDELVFEDFGFLSLSLQLCCRV